MTFPAGSFISSREFLSIVSFDDDVVEETETFFLSISTSDPLATITSNTTNVNLFDGGDGKYTIATSNNLTN